MTAPKTKKKTKGKVTIGIIVLVLLLFIALTGFLTDFLWFRELGYVSAFFKKLSTQLKIGIPVFIVVTLFSYVYFKLLRKNYFEKIILTQYEKSKKMNVMAWVLAIVFGLVVTVIVDKELWFSLLQAVNATDFGYDDPVFGFDVSFYVFKLDFLHKLISIVMIILVLFIVLTVIYNAVLVSVKPKQNKAKFEDEDRFANTNTNEQNVFFEENEPYDGMLRGTPFEFIGKWWDNTKSNISQKQKTKNKKTIKNEKLKQLGIIASKQITVVGVLLFLMLAAFFVLKQFDLLYVHSGTVYGAGYTDIKVKLLVYRILVGLSVLAAVGVVVGIKKRRISWVAITPLAMCVVVVLGIVANVAIQKFIVTPNEISKESQYLKRNIEFTQKAYNLDKVSINDFQADDTLTSEDIQNNDATISNIRINDYQPTKKFYNQTQSIRQYYEFADVDVDRYTIDGKYTQTFTAAREINDEKVSQTWLNKHLQYTHGYGIAVSKVDEITLTGQPEAVVKNIPPESDTKDIEITRPEIYFGEKTDDYAIVGAKDDEFDYPDGDSNQYTRYEGTAGIKLNLFNRCLFALEEKNINILISSNITSDSKILVNRNIVDRVNTIMPYLNYDDDPYIVEEDGRLYWIIDAYTSSNRFPYSEPYDVDDSNVNYVRNSVKVVVDAYNGDVDYYVVDDEDPIAKTYQKIYPTLFKDGDDMPEGLKAHIRYPKALLETQAKVYTKYHMNDARVFYQNEDLWDIAKEIYGTDEQEMGANYYIMSLPGEDEEEFVNMLPFTTKNKRNMTAFMVARNDGENYGELVLYKMPKNKVVYGPRQVEAQIDQDPDISKEFSLWNSAGTKYSRGNMFVVPMGNSILYVEPVYLESADASIPEVKRVIVCYGDNIAYANTLGDALNKLFGDNTVVTASTAITDDTDKDKTSNDEVSQSELIKNANDAYNNAIEAQKFGDWAKYGEYMEQLSEYLTKLNK